MTGPTGQSERIEAREARGVALGPSRATPFANGVSRLLSEHAFYFPYPQKEKGGVTSRHSLCFTLCLIPVSSRVYALVALLLLCSSVLVFSLCFYRVRHRER